MTTKEAAVAQVRVAEECGGQAPGNQAEAPTAIERAARREAARNNAADSKFSDVSPIQVGPTAGVVMPQRVLHRVVMRRGDDPPEVRPLCLDERGCVFSPTRCSNAPACRCHLRNRLITPAVYSPYDVRRVIVQDGLRNTFRAVSGISCRAAGAAPYQQT